MEREDAVQLSNQWYELAQGNEAMAAAYEAMQRCLREFLPSSITTGGAAEVSGRPCVLACDPSALFEIGFAVGNEKLDALVVTRRPLIEGILVRCKQAYDADRLAVVRHWTFAWPGEAAELAFTGVVEQRGGFGNAGPDGAELVARCASDQLGWILPG